MKSYALTIIAIALLSAIPHHADSQTFFESLPGPTGGKIYAVSFSATGDCICLTRSKIFRREMGVGDWETVFEFTRDVNRKNLYCAPSGTLFACTVTGRLLISRDDGRNWVKHNGIANKLSKDIVATTDGTLFHVGNGAQMSTDDGVTWVDRSTGIENAPVQAIADLGGGTLLVAVWQQGIFRTRNAGESWEAVAGSPTNAYKLFCTSTGNVWASSSNQAQYSTDQGTTWIPSADLTRGSITGYCESPSGSLFACSSWAPGGIYRSLDGGASWTEVFEDDVYHEQYGLSCSTAGDILCVNGDGVLLSTDDGDSWSWENSGLLAAAVEDIIENSSGMLFVCANRGGVHRSTDHGQSWEEITASSDINWIHILKRDENDAIYAAGNDYLYRSTDDGINWEKLNPNDRFGSCSDLLVLPSDVLIVAEKGCIYYSSDGGTQWESRSVGLPDEYVSALLQMPGGVLLAAVDQSGMYRSSDDGQTWQEYGDLPEDNWVYSMVRKSPQTLYAVTKRNGVYRSQNDGLHWEEYNNGVHTTTVHSIHVTTSGAVVCGASNGVLLLDEETDTWVKLDGIEEYVDAFYTDSRSHLLAGTDGDGLFSSRTAVTIPAPMTPHLLSPADNSTETGTSPSFSWNAVNNALYYHLQISVDQSMSDPVIDSVFASRETFGVSGLVDPMQYFWRLRAGNFNGAGSWSEVRTFNTGTPTSVRHATAVAFTAMLNVAPNPARTSAVISFALAKEGQTELSMYSLLGEKLLTAVHAPMVRGVHNITLDVSMLPAGVYLCRLRTAEGSLCRRLTVLR